MFEINYGEFKIGGIFEVIPGYWDAVIKNSECSFYSRLTRGIANHRGI